MGKGTKSLEQPEEKLIVILLMQMTLKYFLNFTPFPVACGLYVYKLGHSVDSVRIPYYVHLAAIE